MRIVKGEKDISVTFDSVNDLAQHAEPYVGDYLRLREFSKEWHGVDSFDEAKELSINGWEAESDKALAMAESVIETAFKEHTTPTFHPVWDVTGCEVDVGRYLSGEPENMIDYEIVPTTRVGRVITVCSSVSFSSAVSTEAIKRRGYVVTALVAALSRLGYTTELWADLSAKGDSGETMQMRVLVKGANDEFDPGKVMFAFSHPSMLRALGLPAMHVMPKGWQRKIGVGSHYGSPTNPREDLAEGTIYMPAVRSDKNVPNADVMLIEKLRELGIITD